MKLLNLINLSLDIDYRSIRCLIMTKLDLLDSSRKLVRGGGMSFVINSHIILLSSCKESDAR
jgi:hypothetical protein